MRDRITEMKKVIIFDVGTKNLVDHRTDEEGVAEDLSLALLLALVSHGIETAVEIIEVPAQKG